MPSSSTCSPRRFAWDRRGLSAGPRRGSWHSSSSNDSSSSITTNRIAGARTTPTEQVLTGCREDSPGELGGRVDLGGFPGHQDDAALEALSWGTAAFGLAVHSLVGGVALASAIAADFAERQALGATGWGVFLATVVHKPADAMTIVTLMLRSGVRRWLAHLVNFGFAMMIPAGVACFILGVGQLNPGTAAGWTAIALAFSAGTFLCIALSDLLPELQFHSHDRLKLSLALLAGFCLMVGASAIEML